MHPLPLVAPDTSPLDWTQTELQWELPTSDFSEASTSGTSIVFQIDSQQIPPRKISGKPSLSRKKQSANTPSHIPRPPNAFILFRSSFIRSQKISTQVETNHSTLSKIIGLTWQNLPEHEKEVWHVRAKKELDEHRRRFPSYAFRPAGKKSTKNSCTSHAAKPTSSKRRAREVEPKDEVRCAHVASLLVQGLNGEELAKRMQEFDRVHVKQVQTRFEAPITEKAFRGPERRKSASASAPSLPSPSPLKRNHSAPAVLDTSYPCQPAAEVALESPVSPPPPLFDSSLPHPTFEFNSFEFSCPNSDNPSFYPFPTDSNGFDAYTPYIQPFEPETFFSCQALPDIGGYSYDPALDLGMGASPINNLDSNLNFWPGFGFTESS